MPVSTLSSPEKPGPGTLPILGPATNRVHRTQNKQKDHESLKKKKATEDEKKVVVTAKKSVSADKPKAVLHNKSLTDNLSLNSSPCPPAAAAAAAAAGVVCCNGSSEGAKSLSKEKKKVNNKPAKIVPDGVVDSVSLLSPMGGPVMPIRRCDWLTPNSDPLYIQFHDEEYGVPVRNDKKLFELLILSQALGELTWSTILCKRYAFRRMFEDFDPSPLSDFDEKKLLSLIEKGNALLSEPKLRAVVDNARQFVKIQEEFGSFSNYCWRFVNNKPIKSGYRYTRQVPAKTPKSELISKDLMRRGFRCVGPTVVYSFMQVAGLVNDHLLTCFRYNECESHVQKEFKPKLVKTDVHGEAVENTTTCTSDES